MSYKLIYLLRHSSTVDSEQGIRGSRTDTLLSELGKKQSFSIVSILNKYEFDLIIVSPLQRTIQTLYPYLKTLTIKPAIITEGLITERDLGKFTNTKKGDGKIEKDMKKSGKTNVDWVSLGGESIINVGETSKIIS